jgi:hypothetical protein
VLEPAEPGPHGIAANWRKRRGKPKAKRLARVLDRESPIDGRRSTTKIALRASTDGSGDPIAASAPRRTCVYAAILGLTLGYQLNDNLNLTVDYKSTLNNSSDPTALRMDNFMFTLVYGWHPLIEGSRRLKSE